MGRLGAGLGQSKLGRLDLWRESGRLELVHAGAVEDGVNAGEALVSSFVKQGTEQQEEGSSGAGESWWPDPRCGGADGSWRRSGRGGDVHGAGVLSVLADDTQVGGDIATRRTERGKEK